MEKEISGLLKMQNLVLTDALAHLEASVLQIKGIKQQMNNLLSDGVISASSSVSTEAASGFHPPQGLKKKAKENRTALDNPEKVTLHPHRLFTAVRFFKEVVQQAKDHVCQVWGLPDLIIEDAGDSQNAAARKAFLYYLARDRKIPLWWLQPTFNLPPWKFDDKYLKAPTEKEMPNYQLAFPKDPDLPTMPCPDAPDTHEIRNLAASYGISDEGARTLSGKCRIIELAMQKGE